MAIFERKKKPPAVPPSAAPPPAVSPAEVAPVAGDPTGVMGSESRPAPVTIFPTEGDTVEHIADAYATHLPVLRELGRVVNPKTVVEFGAGPYSTRAFLDRGLFPALERLVSFESNEGWLRTLPEDARLQAFGAGESEMVGSMAKLADADLIFIDSATAAGRNAIIRAVAASGFKGSVVVHDTENDIYHAALGLFAHEARSARWTPGTSVLRQGDLPALNWKKLAPVTIR